MPGTAANPADGNLGVWTNQLLQQKHASLDGAHNCTLSLLFMLHKDCELLGVGWSQLHLSLHSGARLKEWHLSETHCVMVEGPNTSYPIAFNTYTQTYTPNPPSRAGHRRSILIKQGGTARVEIWNMHLWRESRKWYNSRVSQGDPSLYPSSLGLCWSNLVHQHVSPESQHHLMDLEFT